MYDPSDWPMIHGWYDARGMAALPADSIPGCGVIIHDVAVGFLYRTDSSVGLIDAILTNPAQPVLARGRAVKTIVNLLVEIAPTVGVKYILAQPRRASLARFAKSIGFFDGGQHHYMMGRFN
jgi:hypothetical protein